MPVLLVILSEIDVFQSMFPDTQQPVVPPLEDCFGMFNSISLPSMDIFVHFF